MRQLTNTGLTAILALVVLAGCGGLRVDGPIQPSAAVRVAISASDVPVTWGMPISTTAGPVTLRSVQLLETEGLEVVGVTTCEGSPWTADSYLNCAPTGGAWPPSGVVTRAVEGTTVGPGPDESAGLLVGVRLATGSALGTIHGVRIFYSYAGIDFLVDQRWDFEMTGQ